MVNFMIDPIFDKYMEQLGYIKQCDNLPKYKVINDTNIIIHCMYKKDNVDLYIGIDKNNGNFIAYVYRISCDQWTCISYENDLKLFYTSILYLHKHAMVHMYLEEKHNE